jgi:hypothetical protein
VALGMTAVGAQAATVTVNPGESIQAAVDAAQPGDTVKVLPGDYTETHGNSVAVRVTKRLNLVAKPTKTAKVRLLPGAGNLHGILVEPANMGDPRVERVKIKGFTVEGFAKNGIWLRNVNDYKIEKNESINNLENGIFPTLSAKGLVKRNVSYGSLDAALWVEASENVRVIRNELYNAPTGLEVTVSKDILVKKNDVHDNTIGIGLYHPNGASLPALGGDGDWEIVGNKVYNNNLSNPAPPGSLSAELPNGGGILVLGVDRVTVKKNEITNNGFFGVAIIDWCVAVAGSDFDCALSPPEVEPSPDDNQVVSNDVSGNGLAPPPGPFAPFARDLLVLGGTNNCFSKNTPTATTFPVPLPECV